jgi:hypothetical protein
MKLASFFFSPNCLGMAFPALGESGPFDELVLRGFSDLGFHLLSRHKATSHNTATKNVVALRIETLILNELSPENSLKYLLKQL